MENRGPAEFKSIDSQLTLKLFIGVLKNLIVRLAMTHIHRIGGKLKSRITCMLSSMTLTATVGESSLKVFGLNKLKRSIGRLACHRQE